MQVHEITTSYLVSKKALLTVRLVFAIYSWSFLVWRLPINGIDLYRFLTILSWMGIALYFTIMSTLSLLFWSRDPKEHVSSGVRILVQYFYASTQSIALVVLVIFWLLLRGAIAEFSDSFAGLFFVVSPHVLNFVQTLVELFLGKLPLPLSHIGYMIVTVVTYTVYSWILRYAFAVPFPYPFFDELLDVKNTPGKSTIASLAFLAFFSVMYLFVWALGLLRNWILKSAIEADKKIYGPDDEPQTQTSDTIA